MKRKRLSWHLVQYELRNTSGNIFVFIFGVFFPIMMCSLFSFMMRKQVPTDMYPTAVTHIFITMSMIIPMSILLIGYGSSYALELEKDVTLRLNLFGFRERTLLAAKMIANLIFTTVAFLIYLGANMLLLDVQTPKLSSAICFIVALYTLSAVLFILAHGLATLIRRSAPMLAVTMIIHFGLMILCGVMGIRVEQLPKALYSVAKVFPLTYITRDFIYFWQGGSYNFASLIQSFLFFGAVSAIILILGIKKNQRVIK